MGSSKEMMGSAADTPRCEGRFATAHINDHTRPAEQSDPTWAYLCCTHVSNESMKERAATNPLFQGGELFLKVKLRVVSSKCSWVLPRMRLLCRERNGIRCMCAWGKRSRDDEEERKRGMRKCLGEADDGMATFYASCPAFML